MGVVYNGNCVNGVAPKEMGGRRTFLWIRGNVSIKSKYYLPSIYGRIYPQVWLFYLNHINRYKRC